MSLVVWLPLNGNLDNQGLSNVTVTNNGATVDNNGKIGKCYKFNNQYMTMPMANLNANNGLTLSCWVYPTANASGNTHLVTFAPGAGWSYNRFGLFLRNGTTSVITTASDGTNTINYTCQSSALPLNTWTHVCSTYSNRKLTVYLNGVQNITYNITFDISLNGIDSLNMGGCKNGNETLANCKLNDVRFYDHCLSAKEVKELAKGLVLHYRLAGPGQENFILESHKVTSGSAATGITRNYTSEGYLKVVSTSGNGNWCSVGFAKDSNANVGNKLSVGDTYTMSVEIKVENGTILPSIFINDGNSYKRLQGTIKINQWVQYSYTAVWNAPGTSYGNISLHLGFSGAIGTYYFRNFKLEKGSVATPWCPAPGDVLYDALGYNNNIEYDCSGYRRNGTKSGIITWDIDSPRYTTSYKWPVATSAANRIISPNCRFDGKGITMAVWVKFTGTTAGGGNYHMPLESSSPGYYEMSVASNGILRAGIYVNGTRYVENCSNPSMYDGKWHHIAMTYDGTKICRYVDAKAYIQTNVTGTANGLEQAFYIGSYGTNTYYYNNNIWESDARIYATALSAEDIAELYHSAVIVDNTGKSYAYEYFEAQ